MQSFSFENRYKAKAYKGDIIDIHSQRVKEGKNNAEGHVEDTENDGKLHLVRVGVRQLIVSKLPDLAN